jgi:hypothetical protein
MIRTTSDSLLDFSGRMILRALDTDGASGQAEIDGGQLLQSGDWDRIEPYGFASQAPAGTEQIVVTSDPQPASIDRFPRPSGLPALGVGETAIYGPNASSYVRAHDDVTVRGKAATGLVHLGRGGTEFEVAYSGIKETEASAVACGLALNQKTANVVTDLTTVRNTENALVTAINLLIAWANAALVPPAPPIVAVVAPAALVTTAMATGTNHSYVSSGSGTTKVDDV